MQLHTFDLWIILHKGESAPRKSHRKQYIDDINRYYNTKFEGMHKYKEEKNFKQLLQQLTLEDVKKAIRTAENLDKENENNYQKCTYKGYEYFKENPSLSLHIKIKEILIKVGIIQ